jgi:hypothetical protein
MIIYQPYIDSTSRVTWYGGESTQLHYEELRHSQWRDINVRTLGGGIPTGMSDMHAKMVDYYHHCQDMELERRMAMAD